jgi:hypothetical protein
MRITIPYPANDPRSFIEVDILYDVIATKGPPGEAAFGINYIGFQFAELWRYDDVAPNPAGVLVLEDGSDYLDLETGATDSPYDRDIRAYIEENKSAILEACRDFELTNADNMV